MTLIFPFVSVKTCACQVEKALGWVPARAKSAKSVIMQFSLKSVLLRTNQIAGDARDFNMNMINLVITFTKADIFQRADRALIALRFCFYQFHGCANTVKYRIKALSLYRLARVFKWGYEQAEIITGH